MEAGWGVSDSDPAFPSEGSYKQGKCQGCTPYNFKCIISTDEVTSLIDGQWQEEANPLVLNGVQNREMRSSASFVY